jgi:hypothetical protein
MMIPKELLDDALQLWRREGAADLPDEMSVEQLGKLYMEFYPKTEEESDPDQQVTWVWDLMHELCGKAPGLALDCVVAAARRPMTGFQAGCLAAGALEDLIADHGPMVIDRVEALARESARFRYLLSGVWPRGQDTQGEVWQRVLLARAPGPDMDQGAPVPKADL